MEMVRLELESDTPEPGSAIFVTQRDGRLSVGVDEKKEMMHARFVSRASAERLRDWLIEQYPPR